MNTPAYRRCRKHQSAEQRFRANARQRMSRHARACDAAYERGDVEKGRHYEQLMDKALNDLGHSAAAPMRTAPTGAVHFTLETTAHWGDAEFEQALQASWDDPQAVDQLMHLIDQRDAQRKLDEQAERDHAKAMAALEESWAQPSPLTSTTSAARRLSATEQARAEYESYVDVQWLQAESDCNGVLLNAEGRAKGIDSRSLFSGNMNRALKYASPELQSWWQAHGRLSQAAFRSQMLGRASDRGARERSQLHVYDVPAW